MLQASGLACRRGDRDLFNDIGFEVNGGDVLRIGGRNGSGKSSLLRILCGLSQPCSGEVRWQGSPIARLREAFWRDVVYIGHGSGLKDDLLAWENLAVAARLGGIGIGRAQALGALRRMGIAAVCDTPVRVLSQGQRKRVALARLCVESPAPLWLLDEPAASLDDDAVGVLCAVLDEHLERGGMVVHATHQAMPLAARRHLQIDLGRSGTC